MFRSIRRSRQQLETRECIEILKHEPRGVLSVLGDDGYPYGMPMNHFYSEADDRIYFHGAIAGHKIDALRRHDKVSFCVYDQGFRREGEWALNIKSVIVFGRMRIVDDPERAVNIIRSLAHKYTDDADYIETEIRQSADHTMVLELIPEYMTGKITNES